MPAKRSSSQGVTKTKKSAPKAAAPVMPSAPSSSSGGKPARPPTEYELRVYQVCVVVVRVALFSVLCRACVRVCFIRQFLIHKPTPRQHNTKKTTQQTNKQKQKQKKLCKAIPASKVATYGSMAAALHSSARAVGQAMRRNPYAPAVPCHRVIAAGLALGGFQGSAPGTPGCESLAKKRSMLEDEGVKFDAAGRVASQSHVLGGAELSALLERGLPPL